MKIFVWQHSDGSRTHLDLDYVQSINSGYYTMSRTDGVVTRFEGRQNLRLTMVFRDRPLVIECDAFGEKARVDFEQQAQVLIDAWSGSGLQSMSRPSIGEIAEAYKAVYGKDFDSLGPTNQDRVQEFVKRLFAGRAE